MSNNSRHFYPGDSVEIRAPGEILATLDVDGTLDGLPFMPEMIRFCGQKFRVARRVEKTCVEGSRFGFGRFHGNNVVFLDDLRCSGDDHGGCGRSCMLFWKEAWLRKATDGGGNLEGESTDRERLSAGLKTQTASGRYFCQSSQLPVAIRPLSRFGRIKVCFREVWVRNRGPMEMAGLLLGFFWRRMRRGSLEGRLRGEGTRTPSEALNLQPGELVEVKSLAEIRSTLDSKGCNRGMVFTFPMQQFCQRRFRVKARIDRRIVEQTGEMRTLSDTVALEGVNCQCYYQFGGCPRADVLYWREIWLRRVTCS